MLATQTKENFIQRLSHCSVCQAVNNFLSTPGYIAFVGVLTVISSLFSAELVVYTCFVLCGIYLSLCGKDYLPLVPLVVCCYIAPSVANNPGRNETSVFFGQYSGIYLLCLAAVFVLSVVLRLCLQRDFWKCPRKLLPGMLALGLGYLFSGAFSGHYFDYGPGNLFFALLQFLSVFLMYFLLTGGICWESAPKGYLAWVGICVGFVLLAQLAGIYIQNGVIVNGEIQRALIYSGWGNYNNIGGLLTLMIPFPFYLACTCKRGWLWQLCAILFLMGVVLTCSRNSILASVVIYVLSYAIMVSKELYTRNTRLVHVFSIGIVFVMLVLFHKELYRLFNELLEQGLDPSNRDEIYLEGFKQFLRYPLFGGTFYPSDYVPFDWSTVDAFTSFFPPRWHNTALQLLASGGIVGLSAYVFHRLQTVKLFLCKPTLEKSYIALSILALLGTSLLDCHFFNIGPVLFYSMALAFAEKQDLQ